MKEFNYTINGTKYHFEIQKEENNVVELEVNGTPFTIEMERVVKKVAEPVVRPAPAGAATVVPIKHAGPGGAVKSPLPGVILDINVKVGDTVKPGDKLMLLEAMKMENTIATEFAGKVLEIKVSKGDSVLEGAELVIIG